MYDSHYAVNYDVIYHKYVIPNVEKGQGSRTYNMMMYM